MKLILFIIFYLHFFIAFADSLVETNETKLVFNIYRKDIHVISIEKLNSTTNGIDLNETDLLVNTTGHKSYVGQIDYSLSGNILIWRLIEPINGIYAVPLNKRFPSKIF